MKKNKDEELVSLNSELPQLYVEELEQRLETDPLMIGGLFDMNLNGGCMDCSLNFTCMKLLCYEVMP